MMIKMNFNDCLDCLDLNTTLWKKSVEIDVFCGRIITIC